MNKILNKKIIFILIAIIFIVVDIVGGTVVINAQENEILNKFLNDSRYKQIASHMPLHRDSADRVDGGEGAGTSGNRAGTMTGTGVSDAETFQEARGVNAEQAESSGFVPLAPIPGVTDTGDTSRFFNGMFTLGIIIAGFLAVIMIAVGGIQYMSTDAVSGKGEGRERITYALMGLLLILFSYILLRTINPDILQFNLFN